MPDRDLTDALLEVIRERMEQDGWSGNRLAVAAGMAQPTLSKHLRGGGTPTVDDFEALALALGTQLEDLLAAARLRM